MWFSFISTVLELTGAASLQKDAWARTRIHIGTSSLFQKRAQTLHRTRFSRKPPGPVWPLTFPALAHTHPCWGFYFTARLRTARSASGAGWPFNHFKCLRGGRLLHCPGAGGLVGSLELGIPDKDATGIRAQSTVASLITGRG